MLRGEKWPGKDMSVVDILKLTQQGAEPVWCMVRMQIGVYYMGCTLAPHGIGNVIEPSMCGGNATFLSNYFDHLFCFIIVSVTLQ